jgi:hypothetical protein
MTPGSAGPAQRLLPTARIVASCRAHPVLVLVAAILALACAASIGIADANMSRPALATTAGAPVPGITRGADLVLAEREAETRDTVVWRDEAGAIYRAKIDGGRFTEFLRRRKATLEAARTESRDQAAAEILAALKPVFADMTARVPDYADWYFGYLTKYELMAHALVPAFDYLGRRLGSAAPADQSLIQAIGPHVVGYLEAQYAERVMRPGEAEIRLQAAFDKSYGSLRAHWERIVEEQREAMRGFIRDQTQAGSAERLSADQTAGSELDWDGSRDAAASMHEEGILERSFRRGLLSVRMEIPKFARAPVQPDVNEETPEQADEITHVIVNLFDKLIGTVVSQMSDLAVGIFAGSAAGGTTVGFGMAGMLGMAGGLGVAGPPAAIATGVANAVPIGAAIGLAATVVAEMLTNRLEASLSRAEFEEGLRQTVEATENAIETGIVAVLHEHVEGWYADIVNPVAVK